MTAPNQERQSAGPAAGPSHRAKIVTVIIAVAAVLVTLVSSLIWRGALPPGKSSATNAPVEVKVETPAEPGLPNTLAELNTWYAEPPAGSNAATFFLKGFAAINITDADLHSPDLPVVGQAQFPPPGEPLSAATKFAIADLVRRNQAAYDAFAAGAALDQSRYPADLNQGFRTSFPYLAKLKQAIQLTEVRGMLLADSGSSGPATENLLTALACGLSPKNEPVLISQLVRVSSVNLVKSNLEFTLNTMSLPPADLERLASAFASAEAVDASGAAFTRALAGERALNLALCDLPVDQIEATLKEATSVRDTARMTVNLKEQRAFAEETYNHAILLRKQPFTERLKADDYMRSRADEAQAADYPLCMILLPALGLMTSREASGLAIVRVAQTAIALERFRAANGGHYPASLNDLAPAFLAAAPKDPLTGDLLGYQRQGDGYELSSTGKFANKPITFQVNKPPKLP